VPAPPLLLVGFALGPLALVPELIAACVAPLLLVAGAIWLYAAKRCGWSRGRAG
jgi:hypothetical protein